MALPNVTPEQRAKALEKAAQVRKARKELKENIKSGKTDPASILKTRTRRGLSRQRRARACPITHISAGSST